MQTPLLIKKTVVRILDEHGKPTAARIRITGFDSTYYAPDGHRVDFPINAISWLQQSGSFPSQEAKQEVLNSFKKGIEMYRKLAK